MIFEYMQQLFGPNPKPELNYTTDAEFLIAIILSAQCTDKKVNLVTPKLFHVYKTATQNEIEDIIRPCGLFRTKAKAIIQIRELDKIPATMEELVKLPGVGRKTASVFLSQYHNVPAIAVDTHVIRVSNRLALTKSKNPEVIERDLMKQIPEHLWNRFSFYLVLFGRYHCTARNPKCDECRLFHACQMSN